MIYNYQRGGDSVDWIDARELCSTVVCGEGEQCAADDARYAAEDEPSPAVGGVADAVAYGEGADDGDQTRGSVEEGRVGGGEAEGSD